MKHTAGPWHVVPTPESSNQRFKVFSEILSVALVYYDKDDEANARLIAAAPELLESAIDVLRWAETPIGGQSEEECREKQARTGTAVCSKLRAAIAKATGELQ